jgi:hypothetical protein
MNFFGHATIASRRGGELGFVLGAMLPDFATMLRRRSPETSHVEVGRGIWFHHRTDAVFHDAPTFRSLSLDACRWLIARGLGRGSARAVAHVGVELLLDSVLAHDVAAVAAYRAALSAAGPDGFGRALTWTETDAAERFEELRRVLCSREPSRARVAPELVAARLKRVLHDRPRLAFDDRGESIVARWCDEVQHTIGVRAPALIAELNEGLDTGT